MRGQPAEHNACGQFWFDNHQTNFFVDPTERSIIYLRQSPDDCFLFQFNPGGPLDLNDTIVENGR